MSEPKNAAPPSFGHVDAWVFDLDNTLYPSECDLFAQIDARMTAFVAKALDVDQDEAHRLQKHYYATHGTTLAGLMREHGIAPGDYLDFVHDIDLSGVSASAVLRARIDALPGKKYVFTNGSMGHAERVTAARGLEGAFDGMFDIEAAGFTPKPSADAYARFLDRFAIDPARAAMFEDLQRNLAPAADLGMVTVLVTTGKDWSSEPPAVRPAAHGEDHPHVHHVTDDLTRFLGDVGGGLKRHGDPFRR